jgi:Tol biopolymer transport system component
VACYPYQGAYVAELRVMTLTGETIRTLPAGVSLLDDVSFSPDGTAIVYWGRNDPADDGGQLYAVPADGSGPARQLTDVAGNADADFSPGGDEIAFRRVTPEGVRIYVMAADGSGERAVTDAGWVDQDPTWSPDGNWIAFKSNRPGVLPGEQFWIIDRNGEGLRQLGHYVDGVADNAPAWGHR